MSDIGPWGSRDGRPAPTPVIAEPTATITSSTPGAPVVDKGQSLPWAVVSTLLLGGLIWWTTGSWVVAVAAIFGLFVHEYGHVLAMNRLGMGPAKIYIIPFLGGLARGQRNPKTEWDGVLVSLAGPAFGLLAVIPAVGLWFVTGDPAWMLGAFFIAMINLVNLAPAPPLDGSKALGPVLARIDPMVEKAALILIGALVVWWGFSTGRYILAIFLGIAVLGSLRRGAWRPGERVLSWGEAGQSLGLFLVTAALCAATALGVLLPLSDGSVDGALDIAARFIGFER
ncbi:metalloprotease [Brevundimonas aurifodinae]|uniref:Site-2 protease family protein n=2 Tax=Brevundimonas TaxID=41275 RepID=A0ABV1NJG3_9CAUL|nr:MAG: peptidase M50 [Brevundimonas sp. 12-68-7]OYX34906.1 MAG: peptidase M50 [Brevundimonas subvibrioides]